MTREEAARVIESHAKHGFGTGLFGLPEAFTAAVTALRGPQPDPDTGPEGSIRKREKMRSVKKETMDELAGVVAGTARKLLPIGLECIGGDWEETAE